MCTYILYNCYKENQSQKFFLKQAQILDERLPKYDEKKLAKINKKKNNKIKLGFLSADIVNKHSITYFLKTILLKYDKENGDSC